MCKFLELAIVQNVLEYATYKRNFVFDILANVQKAQINKNGILY